MTTERDDSPTSTSALVHGQLCYLQLPAVDVTTSARFYERVFGWRVDPPDSGFEAPALIGQWIDERPASPGGGPVGWIFVHDIQAALRVAEAAGATGCEGPTQDGPRWLGTFTDPAGNLVGIAQHGGGAHLPGAPVIDNRTMPTAAISPQLVYEDVGAAIAWLCETFGFTVRWRAGDHRAQLAFGNGCVIVTEPRTSEVLPGRQSVMVRVADADRPRPGPRGQDPGPSDRLPVRRAPVRGRGSRRPPLALLTVDRRPRARGVGRDLRTGVSRSEHEPERLTCGSRTGHQMGGRSRLWCAA